MAMDIKTAMEATEGIDGITYLVHSGDVVLISGGVE